MPRRSPLVILVLVLLAVGCEGPQPTVEPLPPPEGRSAAGAPSYRELVERYNANVGRLDQLWSRSVVELRWEDEEGDRHFEQGEGHFIFVRPNRVALTVGKLGETILWAGSNEQRYWLFDLQEQGKVYFGARENYGKPCTRELPLPINPETVPYLLGLLPLAPDAQPASGVRRVDDGYVIAPPELNLRLLLDAGTAQPRQVDLIDEQGQSVVIARLDQFGPVEMQGVGRGNRPRVPTRAEFYAVGEEARMSLSLSGLTDGRRFDRINPAVFNFDALLQTHRPAEVVELDEACE